MSQPQNNNPQNGRPVNQQNGQPAYQQPQQPQQPPQQQFYPNGQPMYQQAPQQQFYPNGQPAVQQVVVAQGAGQNPVSAKDREATFKIGGGILMLIFAIISTIAYLSSFASFSFLSIPGYIIDFFLVLGAWLLWGMCRGKKNNPIGAKFIKFNITFNFIIELIEYIIVLIFAAILLGVVTFAAASVGESELAAIPVVIFLFMIAALVFNCLYFSSVKGCLNTAIGILRGDAFRGPKKGTFAAVVMIIKAVIKFAPSVFLAFGTEMISGLLGELPFDIDFLTDIVSGLGIALFISGLITFLNGILVAVIMLQYNKALD